jgi:hypothetical protein
VGAIILPSGGKWINVRPPPQSFRLTSNSKMPVEKLTGPKNCITKNINNKPNIIFAAKEYLFLFKRIFVSPY